MQTDWRSIVKNYNKPVNWKSNWQVFNSFGLYILSWIVAWQAWQISAWLTLLVAAIAQVFYGRLFIIFHDCGHGNFYRTKKWRTFWGYMTGIVWWSPYWQWTKSHATHHRHSGNLDHRGIGDIWTLTTDEYEEASFWTKAMYRLYRFPLFEVTIGAIYIFFIWHRFTTKNDGKRERKSVYITNVAIILMAIAVSALTSFEFYAFFQFFLLFMGGFLGITFFYVQHQYEEVYWRETKDWDYATAAMEGCSYLKLPRLLQWASGNIGFHHIHHLSHNIPNYHLEKCFDENPEFQHPKILTLKDIWGCFMLGLYDAKNKKMLTFGQYKKLKKRQTEAKAQEKFNLDAIKPKEAEFTA